jgi:radical SAM protein with 4Fe4S-binding SPASM domain
MPNIVITTYCNRRCPYCFALDAMENAPARDMNLRDFVVITDMLVAARRSSVGVLGGEPTLHPQFYEMLWYLVSRGINARVFTNGICSDELMDELDHLPYQDRVTFIVNVNFPEIETDTNRVRQAKFIRRFAEICDLGLNIFRADLDPLFLADVAREAGIRNRRIRVGFAQPIAGEGNEFLKLEDYREVARQIVRLAEGVFDLGIMVSLDCGFPLCAFSDEELGRLRRTNANTKFVCDTATDIAPGLTAWSCFPLAKRNRSSIERTTRLQDLEKRFVEMNAELRQQFSQGIFKECETCQYLKQRVCHGGCLAHVVADSGSEATATQAASS